MKESHYKWMEYPKSEDIEKFAETIKQPTFLAQLLWNRQLRTEEEVEDFLHPTLEQLHSPYDFADMQKAKDRILEAIETGESILIYGDYDCDGITASTILKETIESIGGEAKVFLPNRIHDGYGPNKEVYQYFIEKEQVSLIITVDNGIAGLEAIQYAEEHGCNVIVTDHHEMKETLPNAYALIHPRLPDSDYPFKELAGVGVAFKLATALLDYVPVEFLDLVAIGTIADLVPLVGENRILVANGLSMLQHTDRIGLQQLAKYGQIDLVHADSQTIGFQIAPRLNALGRLEEAGDAVTLLSTFDVEEAEHIAEHIEEVNQERKALVETITAEALTQIDKKASVNVLASQAWHEGVLGIVASRIVEQTHKPTIVLSINPETAIAKGSARGVNGIHIVKLLDSAHDLLLTYGGHEFAAGLSLKEENIKDLKDELEQSIITHHWTIQKETLMIEDTLSIQNATNEHYQLLSKLEPFGQGNPRPLFKWKPQHIKNPKLIGKNQTTMKAIFEEEGSEVTAIQFHYHDSWREWLSHNGIDFVGELTVNEWNGEKHPQLNIKDYQISGIQVFDGRMQRLENEDFMKIPSVYIYFNPYHRHRLEKMFPNRIIMPADELDRAVYQIVICDVPEDMNELISLIHKNLSSRYVVMCRAFEEAYLNGMPTKDDFVRLFKFIASYPQVDVVHRLQDIAHFVKIPMQNLIFMINLFKELGFVMIHEGMMTRVETPKKQRLEESPLYKRREQLIENEAFLLYSDIETLNEWFQQQEEQKEL